MLRPGEEPALWKLPGFSGDNAANRPPSLVGQGFRTSPEWLIQFLNNPSLTDGDIHRTHSNRNGVRTYLQARMPSFHFSENEIGKLVRFFAAMATQPSTYIPPEQPPLQGQELAQARDLFDSGECFKCHMSSDPNTWTELQKRQAGPNFLLTPARLNSDWVRHWLLDPANLMPGTKMPSGLFERHQLPGQGRRWVLRALYQNGQYRSDVPQSLKDYPGDHVDLLVRYLRHFDATEAARH
jgi:hypothetical protein